MVVVAMAMTVGLCGGDGRSRSVWWCGDGETVVVVVVVACGH